MHYLIYKITNLVNNKIYIGKHKTEDINDDYMGSGKILHRAIEKYGLDKFKKEILFECENEEDMNKKEAEIVDEEFVARLDTYNIKLGGQGGFDYINQNTNWNGFNYINQNKLNNKSNQHLISANKIKNNEEYMKEFKEKVSNGLKLYYSLHAGTMKGKKHTEESKRKIGLANSISHKGEKNWNYGNCWIYNDELRISKLIKKDDIDIWIQKGWKKGRKINF